MKFQHLTADHQSYQQNAFSTPPITAMDCMIKYAILPDIEFFQAALLFVEN